MSSRDEILQRVRQGVNKGDFAARRRAAEASLAAPVRGPIPNVSGDLAQRFADKAVSLASTVARVADQAQVPGAIAAFLDEHGLGREAVVSPEIVGWDWADAGLTVAGRGAQDADRVGITGCFCAIAETGTLMVLSGPATPATVSLLPETHIAVVPAQRIVPTMEDAFGLLRAEVGAMPRAVNLISGPSRTGDIEQTLVLGAHGPCRVHLIVVG